MPRQTKIIATVGPACHDLKMLTLLLKTGVDIFRINVSHVPYGQLKQWIDSIRKAGSEENKAHVPILLDLQGPRIRTGKLKEGIPMALKDGAQVVIVPGVEFGGGSFIVAGCSEMPAMLAVGDPILIDNGMIELRVEKISDNQIDCHVVKGGMLGENKGINLPAAPATLPALTENDRQCIEIGCEEDIDYIALSFVRTSADIGEVLGILKSKAKAIPVIAKIEKPSAVKNISSILAICQGIMVARGDLGVEMGLEKVPILQKQLIHAANQKKVPVITATQMLESMMNQPQPTRAEASDIANAVLDGSDMVMLSGETAIGKYSAEAVRFMVKVIREAEAYKKQPNNVLWP
ncbi:MAG: pyruvate kinase [Candidatus Omnitrophota bacterium]|nr:pyruvate kinase [Candidatus Omnitrophota bacterium]